MFAFLIQDHLVLGNTIQNGYSSSRYNIEMFWKGACNISEWDGQKTKKSFFLELL